MTSMSETIRSPKADHEEELKLSSSVPSSPPNKPRSSTADNRVKMKYFQSLGMNQPPPIHSGSMAHSVASTNMQQIKRERCRTTPTMTTVGFDLPPAPPVVSSSVTQESALALGHRKKRSISVPDMLSAAQPTAIPIPVRGALGDALRNHQVDSDDDFSPSSDSTIDSDAENDEGSSNSGEQDGEGKGARRGDRKNKQFIPPHEMLQQKDSFQVGTARSLALWETRRRAKMNVI